MKSFETWKNNLKALPGAKKLIAGGAILTTLGVFLPWYRDVDRFNLGDTFLGITGPLYLAGTIVLLGAMACLIAIATEILDKKFEILSKYKTEIYYATSSLTLFMLLLVNSVYFHAKFGVSLTEKSRGIGMTLSFIGAVMTLCGALWQSKFSRKKVSEEHLKNVDNLNNYSEERKPVSIQPAEKRDFLNLTKPVVQSTNADELLKNYFNQQKKND